MVLSDIDRQILSSYKAMVDSLADYLSPSSEVVLHSLEDYNNSVIKIANGHHTGRKIGAPITDIALKMLSEIKNSDDKTCKTYFTRAKNGNSLKSNTTAIYGEKGKIIGLLCMNLNLDTSFVDFVRCFFPDKDQTAQNSQENNEIFANSTNELVLSALDNIVFEVNNDSFVSSINKNKEIIKRLHDKGIFNIKDSPNLVADYLKISKNTVYLHLRNYSK